MPEVTAVDYLRTNDAERDRLARLVDRLSAADLGLRLGSGWTIAVTLAHIAFWDRYTLDHWERRLRFGRPFAPLSHLVDVVNAAAQPLWEQLDPQRAGPQALEAAERIDRLVGELPAELVAEARSVGMPRLLDRAAHRREHLDEIEARLRG